MVLFLYTYNRTHRLIYISVDPTFLVPVNWFLSSVLRITHGYRQNQPDTVVRDIKHNGKSKISEHVRKFENKLSNFK